MTNFEDVIKDVYTPQELENAVDKAKYEVYVHMAVQALTNLADHIAESTDPFVVTAALETVLNDYNHLLSGLEGDDE